MNANIKKLIYDAFVGGKVEVQSVTRNKVIEWKPVTDVMQHDVSNKKQYKVEVEGGVYCTTTEDHSLFIDRGAYIEEYKTGDFNIGDLLVFIESDKVLNKKVNKKELIPSEGYMYDLSVKDNENFVLKSGVLAHNSFRPPASEKFLQAQAQVFGYIWEDYELYEYLLMSVDFFNTAPPVTGISLFNTPDRWRSVVLLKAASIACGALAINWIVDEYSIIGDERLIVKDENNIEYNLTIKELYDMIYGEMILDICNRVDLEIKEAMTLIWGWEDEDKQKSPVN
jgi:hypothetical protein